MKLLIDMNLSPSWVERLSAAGVCRCIGQAWVAWMRPPIVGDNLIAALRQMAPELAAAALLTIDPSRTRLNLLPLRAGD